MWPPPPPPLAQVPSVFPWQKSMPTTRNLLHSLQLLTPQNTLQELQMKRSSAQTLVQEGKVEHAIERLRVVVSGLETVLSSTHNLTMEASYELAELLGNNDNMGEANSLLDWLGSELASAYGLRSQRTILHYVKVLELLRSWSREEDAKLLLYKIADGCAAEHPSSAPKIPGALPGVAVIAGIPETDIKKLFRDLVDESDADVQLRVLEMLLSATHDLSSGVEDELKRLISYCESTQMTAQTAQARHCLSRFYATNNMKKQAMEVLDAAIPALEKALDGSDPPSSRLLQHCREVAFAYYDLDAPAKCDTVLELAAQALERYPHGEVSPMAVVAFLSTVGTMWQKRTSWESAEPWYERALLSSIKLLGVCHERTVILEKTLKDRSPPMTRTDIPSVAEMSDSIFMLTD